MVKVTIETRVDIIELAKAYKVLESQTFKARSRSELVALCIKTLANLYEGDALNEEDSLRLLRDALGTSINLGRTREGRVALGGALRKTLQTSASAEFKGDEKGSVAEQIAQLLQQTKPSTKVEE